MSVQYNMIQQQYNTVQHNTVHQGHTEVMYGDDDGYSGINGVQYD